MLGSDNTLAFNSVELLWAQRQKGIFVPANAQQEQLTGQTEQARKGKFEQGFESKRGMYCAERMVGGVDSVYFLFF